MGAIKTRNVVVLDGEHYAGQQISDDEISVTITRRGCIDIDNNVRVFWVVWPSDKNEYGMWFDSRLSMIETLAEIFGSDALAAITVIGG